jgi:purine-binding chemotaxis protein CheW
MATPTTAQAPASITVALVEVAGQSLGLLASDIVQVKAASPVTRLPGAPMLIEGIIDLHGEIVPVLDGRRRLGISHRDVRSTDQFVVLRVRGRRLAMHVDAAAGVVEVPAAEVRAAADLRRETFGCMGIARLKGGLFLVHDADALITPHEFVRLAQALQAVPARSSYATR